MKIAVFLSSRTGKSPELAQLARRTGAWLAENGHELVYGGEDYGLMSVLANSVIENGGRSVGVIPNLPLMMANVHPGLNEYIYVPDMAERKTTMLKLAEGFIALPGGYGTLDEFSEVLCENRLSDVKKPLALLNQNAFYTPFRAYLENMLAEGMIDPEDFDFLRVADSLEDAAAFLEGFGKCP
ncbi:MAG: TIGR00730 family Rossman fold protein [Lachnospiraceae bacterium]|nr:TIGR00730 family Rossman fold protein [Lachnospiraceae bacterium]